MIPLELGQDKVAAAVEELVVDVEVAEIGVMLAEDVAVAVLLKEVAVAVLVGLMVVVTTVPFRTKPHTALLATPAFKTLFR